MGEEENVKKIIEQLKDQKLDEFLMECVRKITNLLLDHFQIILNLPTENL